VNGNRLLTELACDRAIDLYDVTAELLEHEHIVETSYHTYDRDMKRSRHITSFEQVGRYSYMSRDLIWAVDVAQPNLHRPQDDIITHARGTLYKHLQKYGQISIHSVRVFASDSEEARHPPL